MPHNTMIIKYPNFFEASTYNDVLLQDINPAYRNVDQNVFETTPLFWDCECTGDSRGYIRPSYIETCPHCGAIRDECPDSRINEVFIQMTCNPSSWC